MIKLTAINGNPYYLNCDLIYKIEAASDTIVTLVDGKILRVNETPEQIVDEIIEYKQKIFSKYSEVKNEEELSSLDSSICGNNSDPDID
ncbi:MAG: flagellar FlbD family protein [Tissierellales bacterium]|nr:flagellar FlbD family protein [Tissierellales bacterium]